jgi:hypothetical protein
MRTASRAILAFDNHALAARLRTWAAANTGSPIAADVADAADIVEAADPLPRLLTDYSRRDRLIREFRRKWLKAERSDRAAAADVWRIANQYFTGEFRRRGHDRAMTCPEEIRGQRQADLWAIAIEGPLPGVEMLRKILGNNQ